MGVALKLEATEVQLVSVIGKTSPEILKRYRENCNWRYFPKEWIYRNIDFVGKDVLDFGCGTGEITTQLALLGAKKVYGLDVTPGLVAATRRRAEHDDVADRVEVITGFIQDVEPRQVDVVIAFAVLHHCFPLENVLPHLLRWLKPGGTFVAVEPVVHFPVIEWIRNLSGVREDPLDEGERKLNPRDLTYILSQLPGSKLISFRIISRLERLFPAANPIFQRLDRILLSLPFAWKLSGTATIVGRLPLASSTEPVPLSPSKVSAAR